MQELGVRGMYLRYSGASAQPAVQLLLNTVSPVRQRRIKGSREVSRRAGAMIGGVETYLGTTVK